MSNISSCLFANPSFIEGVARILDLGGTLNEYNNAQTDKQADYLAQGGDWRAVGQDIQQAGLAECGRLLDKEKDNGQSTTRRT
jgi:hypothetical protein